MNYQEKLQAIRDKMAVCGMDAYIIYSADPHNSVAVADHWRAVRWFAGFTGWVGTIVVTKDKTAFWTDGRYVLQAQREMAGTDIEQYCIIDPKHPSMAEWMKAELKKKAVIGFDGRVLMLNQFRELEASLKVLKPSYVTDRDLVGELWQDRDAIPEDPVWELDLRYCGVSRTEKLAGIRAAMAAKGADHYLCTALDNLAWITNLRGHDARLYPVFHGYFLLTEHSATLFTEAGKVPEQIQAELVRDGIDWAPSSELMETLSAIDPDAVLYVDPWVVSVNVIRALDPEVTCIEGLDLITAAKARKNRTELANLRIANAKEGANVVRLIKRIKENIGKVPMQEYEIAGMLEEERVKTDTFLCDANVPIVGCRGRAAVLHFRPTKANSVELPAEGLLLFDVCAHYLEGSTDTTRSIALGPLTDVQKEAYTFTLKRHIQLATQKFIYGTVGPYLDAVIKAPYWNRGLLNPAGTGHGMGFVTYIQEGPCKIATDASPFFHYMMTAPIEEGMIFSNEPGVYDINSHAVRIENTIAAEFAFENETGRYLGFETLTYIPLEREAILVDQLTDEELEWVNAYHAETEKRLAPYLSETEMTWLKEQTRPLGR